MIENRNFLFVIRRFSIGGSQVNLLAIINELSKRGNNITLMSDKGILIDKLSSKIKWYEFPFVKLRHPNFRFYKEIRNLVVDNRIDYVFAIDPVLSIETYLSFFFHRKPVFGFITAQDIPVAFPKKWPVIFVNNDRKIIYEERFQCVNTHYIKERLDTNRFKFKIKEKETSIKIGLISRLDPLKEKSINHVLKFFEFFAKRNSNYTFYVIGGGILNDYFKFANKENNFIFKGEVLEIEEELADLDVVFGMASTVLQSMASNCISVVCGDNGIQGVVTNETVKHYSDFHFNIHNSKGKDFKELSDEIEYFIKNKNELQFYDYYIKNNYSVNIGVSKIEDLVKKPFKRGSFYSIFFTVIKYKFMKLIERLKKK